jgi:hypothetical protein
MSGKSSTVLSGSPAVCTPARAERTELGHWPQVCLHTIYVHCIRHGAAALVPTCLKAWHCHKVPQARHQLNVACSPGHASSQQHHLQYPDIQDSPHFDHCFC